VSLESNFFTTTLFGLADKISTTFNIQDFLNEDKSFFKGKKFVILKNNRVQEDQQIYVEIKMNMFEHDGQIAQML